MKAAIFVAMVAWASTVGVTGALPSQDEPCTGHGDLKPDGTCQCTNVKPEPNQKGYVGRNCSVEVYGFMPSSANVNISSSCDGSEKCSHLEPGETICFYTPLGQTLSSNAFINILLNVKEGDSFSAFGVWSGGESAGDDVYPSGSETRHFFLSPTSTQPLSTLTLTGSSIGPIASRYTGLYICASSETTIVTYDLLLSIEPCPSKLTPEGLVLKCGSTGPDDVRHDPADTCPSGVCSCTQPSRTRPSTPLYPSLGFDDCTASIEKVEDISPSAPTHQVEAQAAGTWSFFSFHGRNPHLVAIATASANTSSDLELYFKYGQAPGREIGQYDTRSAASTWRKGTRADLASSVSHSNARAGPWYLGVYASGVAPVSYSLSIHQYECLNNCLTAYDRGACNVTSCVCSMDTFTGEDCGTTKATILLDEDFMSQSRPGPFSDAYEVTLGDIKTLSSGLLRFVVTTAFTPDSILPSFVTERPVLLVSGSSPSTIDDADKRLFLDHTDQIVEISSQVISGQNLFISLYNPLSSYPIGYTFKVQAVASCINGCSSHGTCGLTGTCACEGGFLGPDCSVEAGPIGSCLEGTMKRSGDVGGGRSFSVCICSNVTDPESCAYSPSPLVVTCDERFELRGIVEDLISLSDGKRLAGGGSCLKIKRGTSGGMVFFYCVLSLFLCAALVLGAKLGLERYIMWRQSHIGYDSMGSGSGNRLFDTFLGRGQPAQNDDW